MFADCTVIERSSVIHMDARSWATNPDDRYMMVNDLEDKYLRIGETREQVRSLLGSDGNDLANGDLFRFDACT